MKTYNITCIPRLKKNLLKISINFFNIDKLSECLVSGEKCNGCQTVITKQDAPIKKACLVISEAVSVLSLASETLLSSSCISKEEKITLADKVRSLSCDIKVFLLARSHILSSCNPNESTVCDYNNRKNIKTLFDTFISVIDVK